MQRECERVLLSQFERAGLPTSHYASAMRKIWDEVFDIGDYVMFCENVFDVDDIDCKREIVFPDMPYILASKVNLEVNNQDQVFLVDHTWMTTFPQSRLQLRDSEILRDRIKSMVGGIEDSKDYNLIWNKIWPHLICFTQEPDAGTASSCD